MATKKTVKAVKKVPANAERYIKITFSDEGVGISGNYVSSVNHIEAILALIYSLHESCPDMGACRSALNAINFHREFMATHEQMAGQLEKLRDALKKGKEKAEKKLAEAKKASAKKTTKK